MTAATRMDATRRSWNYITQPNSPKLLTSRQSRRLIHKSRGAVNRHMIDKYGHLVGNETRTAIADAHKTGN